MSSSIVTRMFFQDLANPFAEWWLHCGDNVLQILIPIIILIVFWILLTGDYEDRKHLLISLSLIIIGVFLTSISPYSEGLKTIFIGTLFSPLIVYIYEFLKTNKKISDAKDKLSYEYRWKQVEIQSNLLGELIGELATHVSALKSYGIHKLETKRWNSSVKSGLISDIHTLSIARYYHLVKVFNGLLEQFDGLKKSYPLKNFDTLSKKFSDVKQTLLTTENAIFHCLSFDLGLLQQNYLATKTVKFPFQMNMSIRKRLGKFGLLKQTGNLEEANIFSKEKSEKFNIEMVRHLNYEFAELGLALKNIEEELSENNG